MSGDRRSVTAVTSGEVLYIVDWDLPEKPAGPRRAFYRRLRKVCLNNGSNWERSTFSVLKTRSASLAKEVYVLACQYGRANLYEARVLEVSQV